MRFLDALRLETKKSVMHRGVRMSRAQRRRIATGGPMLGGDFTPAMQRIGPAQRGKVYGDTGKAVNVGTSRAKLKRAGVAGPTRTELNRQDRLAKRRAKLSALKLSTSKVSRRAKSRAQRMAAEEANAYATMVAKMNSNAVHFGGGM